jgi:hypothetical protein
LEKLQAILLVEAKVNHLNKEVFVLLQPTMTLQPNA